MHRPLSDHGDERLPELRRKLTAKGGTACGDWRIVIRPESRRIV